MKKLFSLFSVVVFFITSCTNNPDFAKQEQQKREAMEKFVEEYNDNNSSIKAEYDEQCQCVNLSWKCKTLTASYKLYFKDLLSDNPTSYAKDFLISMVIFKEGVTEISRLEFVYEGITFKAIPFTSETIDEKGVALAAFNASNETTISCFNMLSNLSGLVTGKICTNKGAINIPLDDVFNLRGMARSYVIDGGKFE